MLFKSNVEQQKENADLSTVTYVDLRVKDKEGTVKIKTARALFDTGSSETLVSDTYARHYSQVTTQNPAVWTTRAGQFVTKTKAKLEFQLPEFSETAVFNFDAHVDKSINSEYAIIFGRDFLQKLQIKLDFKERLMTWNDIEVPMKDLNEFQQKKPRKLEQFEGKKVTDSMNRIKHILEAKYKPADLQAVVEAAAHLTKPQKSGLYKLLVKYNHLFDGTLGKWTTEPYKIELKEGATPYYSKPWPVPKIHENVLKEEINRLESLGVLRKAKNSGWGAPTFIIPKKDGTVRFISDFRELNKRIKRKPFPIPKIQDLMLKLEGFQYATALDLNMGYYHVQLDPASSTMCSIVTPWGKYEYVRLPMGLANSPDIFQENMTTLFRDL